MTSSHKSIILGFVWLSIAGAHPAPPEVSVTSSTVSYLSGKDTVSAYLSIPEKTEAESDSKSASKPKKDRLPAVILIHEWWGLTPWMKENAEKLAQQGWVALAIDLYRGRSAENSDEAHQLMRGVPEDRAVRDLKAAFEYLRSRDDVDGGEISSIGWCMGGGYSLQAASSIPELDAAVVCYGRLITDSSAIAGLEPPILGIFGAKDKGIPEQSVLDFEGTAKGMKKEVRIVMYPEAGHAFMNPGNKEGYREADANDAWMRILAFLSAEFKDK